MAAGVDPALKQKSLGRYAVFGPISSGGMATVHFGRLLGPIGFSRTVAIKRLLAPFARDPEFVAMFLDEARLAARIHHPNVVGTFDVAFADEEIFLVMEYVRGLSLSALVRAAQTVPPEHALGIMIGALHGLHAAHEAKNPAGESLDIVHRDVSPPNVLVGEDGVARVIDFGVAKARERIHSTRDNDLRGKVRYMAPEQLVRDPVDRRADIYSSAVVLWELLTARPYVKLDSAHAASMVKTVLERNAEPPSSLRAGVPPAVDDIVRRGLAREPAARFATALEMASALEAAVSAPRQGAIGAWVRSVAAEPLAARAETLRRIEAQVDDAPARSAPPASAPAPSSASSASSALGPLESVSVSVPISVPVPPPVARAAVSVTPPKPPSAPRRDLRPLAAAAALVAVVAAWFGGSALTRARSAAEAEGARASTEIAIFPPPPPVESPPVDSAEATATPSPAPSGSQRTSRPHPKIGRATCNPPYKIVDGGIRVAKPECL